MAYWRLAFLLTLTIDTAAAQAEDVAPDRLYRVAGGKVDDRTYNGFRRYHAGCNHCHGSDALGSSFGPSLIDAPLEAAAFRDVVRNGRRNGSSVMKGFAGDANVEPYLDDIYAYLQARADGAIGRGRPARID